VIDPKEVIRTYTVEELCETADAYYRAVDDPTPLMSKPFAFLHETPEMLQNLGLVLGGLQLGRTMTVLDFGAGTCWLSRILTQLNCQAICCDTSRAALAIGQRLFAEMPLIGTTVFTPTFLWFDGHHLDLPDASVDRIVSFDAFHHVPNADEVIGEFGRVLKPGGIAGFSEPGRRHSRTPQSQYEMRNHRVLENDIDVNEIFGFARQAGFTDLSLAVVSDMTISLDEHNALFGQGGGDALRSALWNHTHNAMHNRAIFFLRKGEIVRDSRSHLGLAHELVVEQSDVAFARGERVQVTVHLRNVGTATWLHQNAEIFGTVRLGAHLYDADGDLVDIDFLRHSLPERVAPGASLVMHVPIDPPAMEAFELVFDLVSEGVTWFENVGSKPVRIKVRAHPVRR
jgi:SAM-dependent methyltransferase